MFKLIYGNLTGAEKRAAEFVNSYFSEYLNYTLPSLSANDAEESDLSGFDLVVIGTVKSNKFLFELSESGAFEAPTKKEGYLIKIMKNPRSPENTLIILLGADSVGAMYASVDLGAYVLPYLDTKDPDQRYPLNVLCDGLLSDYERVSAPALADRGIWTWGHVIYDYKSYIANMARLKMNTLILWNDRVPANIDDITATAHSYGIKIYLGFSWGWNEARSENGSLDISDEARLADIQRSIVENYRQNYMRLDIDGVYFQSFTEFSEDVMNGVCIADRVVKFVNDTALEILKLSPDLKMMFGLHATSVASRLDAILKTDPRIMIVWEDLGAFPYAYTPRQLANYSDTVKLSEKVAVLRGENELFGVVTKGLICLDWSSFKHIKGEFIMGMQSRSFIEKRTREKAKVWKYIDAYWIKNAEYALEAVKRLKDTNSKALVTGLIEDGMLEDEIHSSAAIFAELLWDPCRNAEDIILEVLLRPDTK